MYVQIPLRNFISGFRQILNRNSDFFRQGKAKPRRQKNDQQRYYGQCNDIIKFYRILHQFDLSVLFGGCTNNLQFVHKTLGNVVAYGNTADHFRRDVVRKNGNNTDNGVTSAGRVNG